MEQRWDQLLNCCSLRRLGLTHLNLSCLWVSVVMMCLFYLTVYVFLLPVSRDLDDTEKFVAASVAVPWSGCLTPLCAAFVLRFLNWRSCWGSGCLLGHEGPCSPPYLHKGLPQTWLPVIALLGNLGFAPTTHGSCIPSTFHAVFNSWKCATKYILIPKKDFGISMHSSFGV